jgi:hypothetical protein
MGARSSSPKRASRGERAQAPHSKREGRVVPLRKAAATLLAAIPTAMDESGEQLTVRVGSAELTARLGPGVSPTVVRTSIERGETVVVVEDGGLVVIGALRTSPTPGIEKGEDYVIEAKRLELRGDDRIAIVAGGAQILLSAIDRIEVVARDITSRARRVHKLVGRMLHLN